MTGQIQLMVTDMVPALPHIRSGKLRALAVTDRRRIAVLPDIPTVDEAADGAFPGVHRRSLDPPKVATATPFCRRVLAIRTWVGA